MTFQFLTPDPLSSLTLNPYQYAGNNPLNSADPSGALDSNVFLQCSRNPGTAQCAELANAASAPGAKWLCLRNPIGNNGGGGGCTTTLSDSQARTDIGIALGVASLPLGVGAAAGATIAGMSGITLTLAAVGSGALNAAADLPACAPHDATACLGFGLGITGAGFGLGGPALGLLGTFLDLNGAALDLVLGASGAIACW